MPRTGGGGPTAGSSWIDFATADAAIVASRGVLPAAMTASNIFFGVIVGFAALVDVGCDTPEATTDVAFAAFAALSPTRFKTTGVRAGGVVEGATTAAIAVFLGGSGGGGGAVPATDPTVGAGCGVVEGAVTDGDGVDMLTVVRGSAGIAIEYCMANIDGIHGIAEILATVFAPLRLSDDRAATMCLGEMSTTALLISLMNDFAPSIGMISSLDDRRVVVVLFFF